MEVYDRIDQLACEAGGNAYTDVFAPFPSDLRTVQVYRVERAGRLIDALHIDEVWKSDKIDWRATAAGRIWIQISSAKRRRKP